MKVIIDILYALQSLGGYYGNPQASPILPFPKAGLPQSIMPDLVRIVESSINTPSMYSRSRHLSREQKAAPETPLLRLRNSWMLSTPMPTAIQAISSPSAAYQVITPESNPEIIPHIGNYSQSKKPVNALFTGFFMEPFVGLEPTTC